jgi:hypothetical protein
MDANIGPVCGLAPLSLEAIVAVGLAARLKLKKSTSYFNTKKWLRRHKVQSARYVP